mmetsp:Transcript_13557/g.44020  ORF Transcript_13557/g.44020 Transcript_13557/m.44020 type:complete len:246 (+) Transcript_13557:101-838(+)
MVRAPMRNNSRRGRRCLAPDGLAASPPLGHGQASSQPLPARHTEGRSTSHVLAEQREDEEGDTDVEGHTDHARPGAGIEEHWALVLHDLHRAVHGALVELFRLLALHSCLDRVLGHGRQHRHATSDSTSQAIVDGVGHLLLVVAAGQLHEVELCGEADRLIGGLLGDGGHHAAVQARRALVLEDLHEGVQGASIVFGAPAHVVRHTGLQSLDRGHSEDRLREATARACEAAVDHGEIALVVRQMS